MDKKIRAISGA